MCLRESRGNSSCALRIYRERFPTARHLADSRLITAAFQRVLKNRPIAPVVARDGSQVAVQFEERILDVVRRYPYLGTRNIAKLLRRRNGISGSYWTVHKVLKRNRMRPYKVHKVQAFVSGDHDRRRLFCRWLLYQQERVPGLSLST